MIIRRTITLSLDEATTVKKQRLEDLCTEYRNVVNQYIDMFWGRERLGSFINKEDRNAIDSWFISNVRVDAGRCAIGLIKAARTKNRNITWKKYKKLYAKCAKTGRNHFGILDMPYSKWIKGKRIKNRAIKPTYKETIAELSVDTFRFQEPVQAKSFDNWVNLKGIFPDRYLPDLPVKLHRKFNEYLQAGFTLVSSARIRKAKNGKFYLDVFFQKEVEEPTTSKSKAIGIDVGLKKLFSCSDGRTLGTEIETLIKKLHRRKQGSKRWHQTLDEIKNYIGRSVNQIGIADLELIVMEDLHLKQMIQKGNNNSKQLRKLLGHWNLNTVYRRIEDRCAENRVLLTFVDPAYTSQRCSNCGVICKESRQGERYHCHTCGYQIDADVNASRNILNRYLSGEIPTPHDTKDVHNQ